MASPPPYRVVREVNRALPGFWQWFVYSLVSGLDPRATVTSWYRSPAINASVGGRENSQHLLGTAIDLRKDKPGFDSAVRLRTNPYLEVIEEGDHYHIELGDPMRDYIRARHSRTYVY